MILNLLLQFNHILFIIMMMMISKLFVIVYYAQ